MQPLQRSLVCLMLIGVAITSTATEPSVSRISPPGVQRGTETEMLLTGARLADAKKLLLYQSGIEVISLTAESDSAVKVKLKIPADYPPGLNAIRLATATGISNLRYFGVSALPQATEQEPNGDFAMPQAIQLEHTINGVVKNEDVDYFVVDLREGQPLTVELEGLRIGTEFFDPAIAILDEQRFEVARSDDAPLLQQDCVCSMIAPKAGRYIIEVRESSFGGSDNWQYRLHVGSFPRPLAIVPAGGQPGEKIQATVIDATGRTWSESIQLPSEPNEQWPYSFQRDGQIAPSPNSLRVVSMPNAIESEPDSDPSKLKTLDLPVALNGVLQQPGDTDWFRFRAKKDQQLEIAVFGRRILRSPIDSWLEIHKVGGGRLAANDDSGGPDSLQAFKIPEDGEYLISIRDHLNEGSPFHAYRIEVANPLPSLVLNVAEQRRYQETLLPVPKGSRMAAMLNAQRKNFGGELTLRLDNAPAGLVLTTPKIGETASQIPVMLKASAEAATDAALCPLVAETVGSAAKVIGALDQRTMLVRGQNNRDVWGHNTSRLSVAVTEPSPFDIEVIQPSLPLVRNGIANLLVKAKRVGDFKEPIRIRLLYFPAGISASSSVSIAGDKSEAPIPLTANGNAAIGTFPITVLASARVNGGDVKVASEFINLEVVDSFFDLKFNKVVAELGQSTTVSIGLTIKRPFEGEAEIELVGLPAGVTSTLSKVKVAPDATSLAYPIQVAADARPGQFKTLVCKAVVTRSTGEIVQNQGTGVIQLDKPLVVAVPAVAAAPVPAAPTQKPLSRLEQLRQAKAAAQPTATGTN